MTNQTLINLDSILSAIENSIDSLQKVVTGLEELQDEIDTTCQDKHCANEA